MTMNQSEPEAEINWGIGNSLSSCASRGQKVLKVKGKTDYLVRFSKKKKSLERLDASSIYINTIYGNIQAFCLTDTEKWTFYA